MAIHKAAIITGDGSVVSGNMEILVRLEADNRRISFEFDIESTNDGTDIGSVIIWANELKAVLELLEPDYSEVPED